MLEIGRQELSLGSLIQECIPLETAVLLTPFILSIPSSGAISLDFWQ